ncbi:MAG: hypothetical protein KDD64_16950, partial [Bdellovibrionales bacterium]|nr:hypothetical protein [Bdellovibrionales bacterium]
MVKQNSSLLRRVGLLAGVVCGCAVSQASAMSLVIESCDGIPRLSKEIADGDSVDVSVEGVSTSKGSEVQLIDLDGVSVARSEQSIDGVTFRDVRAGTYRVCGTGLEPVGFRSARILADSDSLAGAAFASSGVGAGALAVGGLVGG